MTTLEVVSSFVSPTPRQELEGELGLDLHEMAISLGTTFTEVKKKIERMEKDNRITLHAYAFYNENGRLVESAVLDIDNSKFFVAKWDSEIGDSYLRHLINCEKKLQSVEYTIEKILADPKGAADILMKLHVEREALKAEQLKVVKIEKKCAVLESNFGKVVGRESGKSALQSENLKLKTKLGEAETYKVAIGWKNIIPEFKSYTDISLGKTLTKLSKDMGYEIRKTDHGRFGQVNNYHAAVAQELRNRIKEA